MRVLAIDWSGDVRNAARRIRVAEAGVGPDGAVRLVGVRGGLDRAGVGALLADLRDGPEPAVVGLDFSFGLPGWFAAAHGARTLPELWRIAHDDGESWLRTCPSPFWGRPGTRKPAADPERPLFRVTERASPARPLSTFQIGGAGAVGTGSIRGMALLGAWRAAGLGVWPLDGAADARVLLVEVYPRELTGPVVKSDAAARRAHVADNPRIPAAWRAEVTASEDAFDAALSAVTMAEHAGGLARLVPDDDPVSRREGRIWRPGG